MKMLGKKTSLRRVGLWAAAGAVACGCFWVQPWHLIRVSGESMSPTYRDGEMVWTWKAWWLRGRAFERGEVVVCRVEGEDILKRIYAIPGDEVVVFRLDDGYNVMVRGGEYLRYYRLVEGMGRARIHRFEVPAGELFLLGDSPLMSLDSRDFGPVPAGAVIARLR